MPRRCSFERIVFFLSLAFAFANVGIADEPKLRPLFNGKDFSNFKSEGAAEFWKIENEVLIGENNAEKKGHYLWTEKSYSDFVLEFDVRWKAATDRGVDTGIEMRQPKIQLQLGVSGSLRVDMTGSFYTGGKPAYPEAGQAKEAKKLMRPEGEWNTFRVSAKGDTFSCWINGEKASEMKCEYRNVNIAEL